MMSNITPDGIIPDSPWSDFTGRTSPVGIAGNGVMIAREHENGSWSWGGFSWVSVDAIRTYARSRGY